jgi:hypothetical protein
VKQNRGVAAMDGQSIGDVEQYDASQRRAYQ